MQGFGLRCQGSGCRISQAVGNLDLRGFLKGLGTRQGVQGASSGKVRVVPQLPRISID